MPDKKKRGRKLSALQRLLLVLMGLSILVAAEIVLRLLPSGPVSATEGDPFVGFSGSNPLFVSYSAPDGSLRLKTSADKLQWFNYQDFPVRKDKSAFRIFTLGGSTTFGRPYKAPTSFSGWLERLLNSSAGATRRYEVINAGGISYASYRVAVLIKELLAYEPDLFVIYTGHNEFLEARTYGDILEQPPALLITRRLLGHLKTYKMLNQAYLAAKEKMISGRKSSSNLLSPEVETLLDKSVGLDHYRRDTLFARGVFEHFQFNVARMIRLCREAKVPVVFCSPVENLKDFSPFKSQNRADSDSENRMLLSILLKQGGSLLAEDRAAEAMAPLKEAVEFDPLYAAAHYFLGRSYLETGDTTAARESFLAAKELDVCPLRAQEPIYRILSQQTARGGVDFLDLPTVFRRHSPGGITGNELLIDHIHPKPEGNLIIAMELLHWMIESGMAPESLLPDRQSYEALYNGVMESLTQDYFQLGILNLAKVLTWSKKYNEVRQILESQPDVVSINSEARYLLGLAYQQLGDQKKSLEYLSGTLAEKPNHRMALTQLAQLYESRGEYELAAETYGKGIDNYPEDVPLLSSYGILLARSGKPDQALEFFRRARQIEPDSPVLHNNIGMVYIMKKRYPQAVESFEEALKAQAHDPPAYHNLGIVYSLMNKPQDAEYYLTEAIRYDPEHASARNNLGRIYRNSGRLNEAEEQFRLAMSINPNLLESYINLALIYKETGRDSLSRQIAEAGLKRFPGDSRLSRLTQPGWMDFME
jgi:tetratricopeptide (TPR) repeat protein